MNKPAARLAKEPDGLPTPDEAHTFVQLFPEPRCVISEQGNFVSVSRPFADLLGYHPRQLVEKHFLQLVHEQDAAAALSEFKRLRAGGGMEGFEVRYRTARGGYLCLSWCVRRGPDEQFYAMVRDLSAEHRELVALRASEEGVRALYQATSQIHLPFAEQAQLALDRVCNYLKLEMGIVSEIEGNKYTVRWGHKKGGDAPASGMQFPLERTYCAITWQANDVIAIANMKSSPHRHHPCYEAFGLESYIGVPLRVHGTRYGTLNFSGVGGRDVPFSDTEQDVVRLLGAWVAAGIAHADVENLLSRQRAELEAIFRALPDAVVYTNLDRSIRRVNAAFMKQFGYSSEEVVGRSTEILHAEQSDFEASTATMAAVKLSETAAFAQTYKCRDGATFPGATTAAVVTDSAGHLLGHLSIVRDVTDMRQAQRELKDKTNQLLRSNSDLERFAYVVSHDLRAPLRAIANLARWVTEDTEGVLSEASTEHLVVLNDRVARMDALLVGLLEYSRIGRGRLVAEEIDIGEVLEDLKFTLAAPAGISIVTDGPLEPVVGARVLVEQMLTNLVGNAIKHHDRATGTIRVLSQRRGLEFKLVVEDDGPGIPPQMQQRAFEVFQRLHYDEAKEGAGIGLAIVKRAAEALGGQVKLKPARAGRGCRFVVMWHWRASAS